MSSAFAHFLRTGQKLHAPLPSRHEAKFNPWHDPANGRFTHVGMGRNYPRGFGGFRGGQSGGGGASGTWRDGDVRVARDAPKPQTQAKPPQQVAQPVIPGPASASPNQRPASRSYPIVRSVERNGYAFSIDTLDRTRKVTGQLQHGPATNRSRSMQSRAGRPDRRPTDDGGHYIARRFNGPREKFNHFAEDANFNRGEYRTLEDGWARSIAAGEKIFVPITPVYEGISRRPKSIIVDFNKKGKKFLTELPNERSYKK